jgi:transposase
VWKTKRPSPSGHEGRYVLRAIVNAIFYQNRTGCQRAYLPNDVPPWSAAYYCFALWRDDGTDQAIHDLLRCQAREQAGRTEDPAAVVLDTQSIRAANHVSAATTVRTLDHPPLGDRNESRSRWYYVDLLDSDPEDCAVDRDVVLEPRAHIGTGHRRGVLDDLAQQVHADGVVGGRRPQSRPPR